MPKKSHQQEFRGQGFERPKDKFGGSLLKGNPRGKRPIHSKLPIHLVMRSSHARGVMSMRHPVQFARVNEMVRDVARHYGVTIYEYANVGNQMHLLIRITNRQCWLKFIRALSGRLAQCLQNLSGPIQGIENFWDHRPFTRIVRSWQRAYRSVKLYVQLNELEGAGEIRRGQREDLSRLRFEFADG